MGRSGHAPGLPNALRLEPPYRFEVGRLVDADELVVGLIREAARGRTSESRPSIPSASSIW